MRVLTLDYVHGDLDWEGVYHLGKLYAEGHTVDFVELCRQNLVLVTSSRRYNADWLEQIGSLPMYLSDVQYDV